MILMMILIMGNQVDEILSALHDLKHKVMSLTERVQQLERGIGPSRFARPQGFPLSATQAQTKIAKLTKFRDEIIQKKRRIDYTLTADENEQLRQLRTDIRNTEIYIAKLNINNE